METQTAVGVMPTFTKSDLHIDKRTKVWKFVKNLTEKNADLFTVSFGTIKTMKWDAETRSNMLKPTDAILVEANEEKVNYILKTSADLNIKLDDLLITKIIFTIDYGYLNSAWASGYLKLNTQEETTYELIALNVGETYPIPNDQFSSNFGIYKMEYSFDEGNQLGRMNWRIEHKQNEIRSQQERQEQIESVRASQPLTDESLSALKMCERLLLTEMPYLQMSDASDAIKNAKHLAFTHLVRRTKNLVGEVSKRNGEYYVIQFKDAHDYVLNEVLRWSSDHNVPEEIRLEVIKKFVEEFRYIV